MSTRTKTMRIEARVTPEQKARIQRAADLAGRSISEFVVASLQAEADRTIRDHEVIVLSPSDSDLFFEALNNPPEPNEALRNAFERHRDFFGA
jgi:uncharacterized protein (DUF1778 family)